MYFEQRPHLKAGQKAYFAILRDFFFFSKKISDKKDEKRVEKYYVFSDWESTALSW